jgi:hypothetical protein
MKGAEAGTPALRLEGSHTDDGQTAGLALIVVPSAKGYPLRGTELGVRAGTRDIVTKGKLTHPHTSPDVGIPCARQL